jgi:hypothetical protein
MACAAPLLPPSQNALISAKVAATSGMSGSDRRVWLIDDDDAVSGGLHEFGLLGGGRQAHVHAPGADELVSVASCCPDPMRRLPVAR